MSDAELKGIIRSLLEIVDAEITTDHDKWIYEREIAAARLAIEDEGVPIESLRPPTPDRLHSDWRRSQAGS